MSEDQITLRREILELLEAAHPNSLTHDTLFRRLREIDGETTRLQMQTALSVLSRHRLVESFSPGVTQPARSRVTGAGRVALEEGRTA
jgi:Fe2+ or Zn2+ uptake regulation protein